MKRAFLRLFLGFLVFSAASAFARAQMQAGPWLTMPDLRLRLLRQDMGGTRLHGGVELRLAPGFKTYWKNPGDSGVPPIFDFSASRGISGLHLRYPLPHLIDDKAGGSLIGYEGSVIFPFTAELTGQTPLHLHLRLDFAVCGTICIPLSVELTLDDAHAQPEASTALRPAHDAAPMPEAGAAQPADIQLFRLTGGVKPRWQVRVPFAGSAASMRAFAEGAGFLTVLAIIPAENGLLNLTLEGEGMPGMQPRFNPARLTFGIEGRVRDVPLDLDGAATLP